jgi:hypothetical protein
LGNLFDIWIVEQPVNTKNDMSNFDFIDALRTNGLELMPKASPRDLRANLSATLFGGRSSAPRLFINLLTAIVIVSSHLRTQHLQLNRERRVFCARRGELPQPAPACLWPGSG